VRPDLKDSHLIQTALEEFTKPGDTAGFSLTRPAGAEEGFAKAQEQLATFARAEFEKGYQAAVDLVPSLSWWSIQNLADHYRFDIKAWVRAYTDAVVAGEIGQIPKDLAPDGKLIGPYIEAFGNLVSPFGDDLWGPSIPYLRGAGQAFRELWASVNTGAAPATTDGPNEEVATGS
jgi:hypothetical protein